MRTLLTPLVKRVFTERYADLARMEDVVLASGLEWTILRPPRLTNGPASGRYRTAFGRNVRGGLRIARGDVASFTLAAVGGPDTVGQIVVSPDDGPWACRYSRDPSDAARSLRAAYICPPYPPRRRQQRMQARRS